MTGTRPAPAPVLSAPPTPHRRWRLLPVNPTLGKFVIVGIVLVLGFNIYPMIALLGGSFRRAGSGHLTFSNYREAAAGSGPISALKNTAIFLFLSIAIALVLALYVALTTARLNIPLRRVTVIFGRIGLLSPPWLVAMAYAYLLAPNSGSANNIVQGWFGVRPFNAFSMPALVFVGAITTFPYLFTVIHASLQNVDTSYEEACRSCGLSTWRTLRIVTVRLVTPAVVTGVAFSFVILGGSFGQPAILGSPAHIYVIATYLYYLLTGFPPQLELAAAIAVAFAVIGGGLLALALRSLRRNHADRYQVINGKGAARRPIDVGGWRWLIAACNALILLLVLALPYYVVVELALTRNVYAPFGPANLTFGNLMDELNSGTFREILWNTLKISGLTCIGVILIGIVTGYLSARTRSPGTSVLNTFARLPLVVPVIAFVVGVTWAWIRSPITLYGTILLIIICEISRYIPLATEHIRDGVKQSGLELEEAAWVCGLSTARSVRKVTLPLLLPVIEATSVLVVLGVMVDLIAPLFLGNGESNTQTMAVDIYELWNTGDSQHSAAAALLLVLFMIVIFGAVELARPLVRRRRDRRNVALLVPVGLAATVLPTVLPPGAPPALPPVMPTATLSERHVS